jgi:hypothetical protein
MIFLEVKMIFSEGKMIFLEVKMVFLVVTMISFGGYNNKDNKIQLENLKVKPFYSKMRIRQEAILFNSSE